MSDQRPSSAAHLASETNECKGKELEGLASVVAEPQFDFKVWNPPAGDAVVSSPVLPDSYFEPTATELKASYQAQVRAREALVNAPLKTQGLRNLEASSKLLRWPMTTIRVKFPDRTQLERSFPSTDKIRTVYAFVRNSLREDVKPNKFVLYQTPPRRDLKVSDPSVRDLTLFELQLAPSSVLLLSFQDDALNDVNLRAPLLDTMLSQSQDLPPPPKFEELPVPSNAKSWRNGSAQSLKDSGNKSMPKWFKLGHK